jgi:hypothetical protein
LGLLKVEQLDTAMKCAWVNRWRREGNGVDVTGSTTRQGNIELINKDLIGKNNHPCVRSIADAWHVFREKMYENDGHVYRAKILSNPGLQNRMHCK